MHSSHRTRRVPTPGRKILFASAVLVFGLVFSPSAIDAQETATLTGKITDRANSQPLVGVHVRVPGTAQGTVSSGDGTYRLTVNPGQHPILVSYVGYGPRRDTLTVAAGETVTRDYTLDKGVTELNAAVIIGTRTHDRTVLNSPVPVDVLTPTEIRQTGAVETSQIIQLLAPSFNFPRPTVADGTDHIRPSTLRGLGPDQVLVLINGKRRHTSALVNVNGTVGRGSTGVDLNAIPASSIERIEILRDGAAAQYGSDAIAGVINIILKSDESTDAEYEAGQNYTTLQRLPSVKPLTDGDVSAVSANTGKLFSGNGFLHVTGQYENRGSTNRSLYDLRPQYFTGDPRNADPTRDARGLHFRQGDARANDVAFFANSALPAFSSGTQVYAFGGISHRNGQGAGNWRMPNNNNTVRSIYKDGFLPMINSSIGDFSGTVGVKGEAKGWSYDLSGIYGRNKFDFDISNSVNPTLGNASPTNFYAGSLKFGEATANLDLVRPFTLGRFAPLNVAVGFEARRDSYGILAGEPDSYRDGGVKVLDGPNIGAQPTPGSQVFAGFQPGDAGDHSRTNLAGYVDLEGSPFERLALGLAGRTEHYSDFGSATIGKVSGRFEFFPGYAIRAAFNSGFRAPSLGQEFFSSTATNFLNIGGTLTAVEVRTLPVESDVAKALGAQPLKAERSQNTSVGLALQPLSNLSLTVDRYHIVIDNRIVFSGNFTDTSIVRFLGEQGFPGVGSARFFTNAIDTRTNGIDVVTRYAVNFGEAGVTGFTGGYNHTVTVVAKIDSSPPALKVQNSVLFDRLERARIEEGQPRKTIALTLDHTIQRFNVTLHTTRFGEVGSRGITNPALDQKYKARWITDANVTLPLGRQVGVTLGVNNIADVYPSENIPANNNSGIFPYNGISPFGFNGRFIYVRTRWER
ncbi:MAG TPA: TonB-dependent receptor [Gemmatimonadaceae bacterium]|nr:TonB-dependent receptor [Gemmatimonadaceae bacterium]